MPEVGVLPRWSRRAFLGVGMAGTMAAIAVARAKQVEGSGALAKGGQVRSDRRAAEAGRLLAALDLNDPRRVEFRALWVSVVSLAGRFDPDLHRRLLAYPADLPDLAALKPPSGNTRPEGVAASYHARRQRGELPDTY